MASDDTSVIYFITSRRRSDGAVKIGLSSRGSLLRRFSQIQVSMADPMNALLVLEGSADQEAGLHELYASSRLNGEWFEQSQDLMELIAELAELDPWWREDFGVGPRWSVPPIVTKKQLSQFSYRDRPRFYRLAA